MSTLIFCKRWNITTQFSTLLPAFVNTIDIYTIDKMNSTIYQHILILIFWTHICCILGWHLLNRYNNKLKFLVSLLQDQKQIPCFIYLKNLAGEKSMNTKADLFWSSRKKHWLKSILLTKLDYQFWHLLRVHWTLLRFWIWSLIWIKLWYICTIDS